MKNNRWNIQLVLLAFLISTSVALQAQVSINRIGKLELTGIPIHDVWGYTDATNGNKYALLCASTSGLRVIDLADITNPTLVGTISGNGVQAIDVKSWKNYAYVVGESSAVLGKIIDLTDPTNPTQVGTFPWAHNITISKDGYMYLSTPGIRIFNLNPDPLNPVELYADNSCNGHDISVIGNTLYDFSDNCGTRIFDISQPDTLVALGGIPANNMFQHSGWASENGKYVLVCDELAAPQENDITVWDVNDMQNPVMVDSFADADAFVHNLYVKGNYAFVSYYRAGFRVFDITNPTAITMVAEYDTDSTASGPGYGGNFGLFTNWGTDTILASDEDNGIYIFSVTGLVTGIKTTSLTENKLQLYPNPATNFIIIDSDFDEREKSTIKIYNTVGVLVREMKTNQATTIATDNFSQGLYHVVVINPKRKPISKPFTITR